MDCFCRGKLKEGQDGGRQMVLFNEDFCPVRVMNSTVSEKTPLCQVCAEIDIIFKYIQGFLLLFCILCWEKSMKLANINEKSLKSRLRAFPKKSIGAACVAILTWAKYPKNYF